MEYRKDDISRHLEELIVDESHIEYFKYLGEKYIRKNPELVVQIMQQVLKVSDEHELAEAKAWSMLYLAWCYQDSDEYESALKFHKEAYYIFEKRKDIRGITYTCNGLMVSCFRKGLYEIGFNWGIKGVAFAEQNDSPLFAIGLMGNIADQYTVLGDYEKAKKYIEGLEALRDDMDDEYKSVNCQVLAEYYLAIGKLDRALEIINESIEITRKAGFFSSMLEGMRIRFNIYLKMDRLQEAEQDIEDIRQKASENGYCNFSYIHFQMECAKLESYKGNNKEAVELLHLALNSAKETNYQMFIKSIYLTLYEIYKKLDKYEAALSCYEQYITIEREATKEQTKILSEELHNHSAEKQADFFKERYQDINLISNVGKKIARHLEVSSLTETIYNEIRQLVPVDVLGISVVDETKQKLDYKGYYEGEKKISDIEPSPLWDESSLSVYCAKSRRSLLIGDIEHEYELYVKSYEVIRTDGINLSRSMIFIPLCYGEEIIGVISVQNYKAYCYNKDDLKRIEVLASYIAIALKNSMLYEESHYFATHDAFTGLYSRTAGYKEGKELLKSSMKKGKPFGIMMLDIDFFKNINDTYGHSAGDEVITAVSQLILQKTDQVGKAIRYGGEEFLILLPYMGEQAVCQLAEELRQAVSELKLINGKTEKLSVSIGIHVIKESLNLEEGIKKADQALYLSKESGRNKVTLG